MWLEFPDPIQKGLKRRIHPNIAHLETMAAENHAEEVLAYVVNISLNRPQQDTSGRFPINTFLKNALQHLRDLTHYLSCHHKSGEIITTLFVIVPNVAQAFLATFQNVQRRFSLF